MNKDQKDQAVPSSVRKQKEDAHKLLDEFEKGQANPGDTPAPPATAAEPPKPGEGTPAPAAPAPTDADAAETLKKQVEQLSATISDLQAFIADEQRDTWKQKFLVIDGKYRAEIQPAAARIKELEGETQRLKGELETARAAKPAEPAALTVSELDKETADEWGVKPEQLARWRQSIEQSMIATLSKQAPQKPAAEPEPAKAPAAEPPAQPAPAQPKVDPARAAYLTQLDIKAPGWREVVDKPEFAKFLNEMRESVGGEPGRTLMEVLAEADASNNDHTVSRVYKAFTKLTAPAPEAPEKPSREAAPSSSKAGSGLPVEKQTWSLERIQQFENDVARGLIRMGSEEYKTLKASRDAYLETITVA